MKSIWFICVNYNSTEDTIRFVSQIKGSSKVMRYEILIVDNSSNQDLLLHNYISTLDHVHLIKPNKNLGYLPGAHYAYEWGKKKWELPDFISVSNVDLLFSGDEILKSIDGLILDQAIGVYAPEIISLISGKDQNPSMINRPRKFIISLMNLIYSSYFGYVLATTTYRFRAFLKSFWFERQGFNHEVGKSKIIYAPHGSFMLFTKKYFEALGTLDFKSFLYGEEIFIAETLRVINLKALHEPKIKIKHGEHKTTSLIGSRSRATFTAQSMHYLKSFFFD